MMQLHRLPEYLGFGLDLGIDLDLGLGLNWLISRCRPEHTGSAVSGGAAVGENVPRLPRCIRTEILHTDTINPEPLNPKP